MKKNSVRGGLPALLLIAWPALGQQAGTSNRVAYEAVYYNAFAPRTALDMINQTPGFVLDT